MRDDAIITSSIIACAHIQKDLCNTEIDEPLDVERTGNTVARPDRRAWDVFPDDFDTNININWGKLMYRDICENTQYDLNF